MISRNELRPIVILEHFTDEMLDKLIPITDLLLFDEKKFIFRQGEKSERFYMLKQGKVLLELKVWRRLAPAAALSTGSGLWRGRQTGKIACSYMETRMTKNELADFLLHWFPYLPM